MALTVVTYNSIILFSKVIEVEHGENLNSLNTVAVISGELCGCEWCQDLAKRCASRRVA